MVCVIYSGKVRIRMVRLIMEDDTLINREITILGLMTINIRLPPIYTTDYIITELIVGERLGIPPPYLKTTSLLFQTKRN